MADLATKELRKRIAKVSLALLLIIGLISAGLIWWFFSARISLISVQGDSMEPTFHDGQTVILNQAYEVEKGMIVVFHKPEAWGYMGTENVELIKRIVAGGGSTVEYDGEKLYVDGEEIYDLEANNYQCELDAGYSHKLSNEELFVLGDNHEVSLDSLRILCDNEKTADAYIPFLETLAYGTVKGTL